MIAPILLALDVAAASPAVQPPPPALNDIEQAIRVGRLEQAQLMVGRAMALGMKGAQVDLILADLAFAEGKNAEALVRYQQLLAVAPDDSMLAERAGIAALRLGNVALAIGYIEQATKSPNASWQAWNARGVVADLQRDWPGADVAYARASALAPDEAEVINNLGWSQLLRGDWTKAAGLFEKASARDPKSSRIANNLELARAALERDLPRRKPGENDRAWAARLNDAGVAALLLGDKQRAVAAFAQALEASGSWYDRAANNLKAANSQ
ncbi:MAG TPA: tetratricopeptide repeat protein [Sphingomicrobium sp.]